jgi:activator of HSP90 ATPase
MLSTFMSRRTVALGLAVLPAGLATSAPAGDESKPTDKSNLIEADGLTRTSEAIHQQITINAERTAVYEALTNAKQFDAITRLSDAVSLVTAPNAKPTSISRAVGGPFTLFGGYITGRNLELVRGERLVQAWRTGSWNAAEYSIVSFVLVANGAGTKLVFDHRGFPDGAGAHLANGWHTHYWDPLVKYLSRG